CSGLHAVGGVGVAGTTSSRSTTRVTSTVTTGAAAACEVHSAAQPPNNARRPTRPIVVKMTFTRSLPLKFSVLSVQRTWALYAIASRLGEAEANRGNAYST